MPLRTLIKAKREVGLCVLELLCLERTPNCSAVLQLVSANKMSEGLRTSPEREVGYFWTRWFRVGESLTSVT